MALSCAPVFHHFLLEVADHRNQGVGPRHPTASVSSDAASAAVEVLRLRGFLEWTLIVTKNVEEDWSIMIYKTNFCPKHD